MKKVFAVIMVMLLAFGMCFNTLAEPEITGPSVNGSVTVEDIPGKRPAIGDEEGDQEITSAMENVPFGDSYYGFCLDKTFRPAVEGDTFASVQPIEGQITSNVGNQEDISGLLKILVVEYFEEFCIEAKINIFGTEMEYWPNLDKEGNFKVKADKVGLLQNVIWNLTDGYADNIPEVVDIVTNLKKIAEDPKRIPKDRGHSITTAITVEEKQADGTFRNTTNSVHVYFDFWVMKSKDAGQQDFFAFKASMTPFSKNPPVNPTNPDNSGANDGFEGSKTELPKTGDAANLVLWIGMLAVSAWGMIAFARRKHVSR